MVTYLIQETQPDVNGSRLAVGGGINITQETTQEILLVG